MISEDTIVAISTPLGRSGIGVVRMTGAAVCEVASCFLRKPGSVQNGSPSNKLAWSPQRATLADVFDPRNVCLVDEAVVTFFKSPNSYTGEDVIEISCHGSPVVLNQVVQLAMASGARMAEPGEFTFRAFFNGRMDLAQAEAIHDLIEAKTLYQAQVALQQIRGSLARTIGPLKNRLVELISSLEAGIDFAEDDVTVPANDVVCSALDNLRHGLKPLIESYTLGRVIHDGISLAIVGRPNVGKSSLFNRLLEKERAIVTDVPGTTRDLISETSNIRGIPVRLVDTAGIRETVDVIEQEGVARSYSALAESDVVLVVLDSSQNWEAADTELLEQTKTLKHLAILNKCDLNRKILPSYPALSEHKVVSVSAKSGAGVEALQEAILQATTNYAVGEFAPTAAITNLRHQQLLSQCLASLSNAQKAVLESQPHEIVLLDLYSGLKSLDSLTGATTVEDILENIFSRFCIGK